MVGRSRVLLHCNLQDGRISYAVSDLHQSGSETYLGTDGLDDTDIIKCVALNVYSVLCVFFLR